MSLVSCTWSSSGDERLAAIAAPTAATYLHAGFGAGPALFTGAGGELVEERRTEPFGQPIELPDLVARDLTELGHRSDPATGWSDHGARWLVPASARWLTGDPPVSGPDPIAMIEPWSLHPYQYVDQNPIVFWDPDGRRPRLTSDEIRQGIAANVKDAFARAAALDLLNPPRAAQRAVYRQTAENIATGKLQVAFRHDIVATRTMRDWNDAEGWWADRAYWAVGLNPNTKEWFVFAADANIVVNGGTAFIDTALFGRGVESDLDIMKRVLVEADHKRRLDLGIDEDQLDLRYRYMRDTDARWTAMGRPDDPIDRVLAGVEGDAEYHGAPGNDGAFIVWRMSYEAGTLDPIANQVE